MRQVTRYLARDNTLFESEAECLEHEKSLMPEWLLRMPMNITKEMVHATVFESGNREYSDGGEVVTECGSCGQKAEDYPNYCPHCGAKQKH